VESVRLPARSPNLNAFAERFVLSIKSECLDKLSLLGEAHLRLAVREYVAHYNRGANSSRGPSFKDREHTLLACPA